jgi:hypothetical protein
VNDEERSAGDEAAEFLEAELGDGGRHLAADVLREARKIGISEPTLRRARKRLGVLTEKVGFGRGWEWCLAKASTPEVATEDDAGRRLPETALSMPDAALSDGPEGAEGVTSQSVTPSDEAQRLHEQTILDDLVELLDARPHEAAA